MASVSLTDFGPQAKEIERRRRLAELLQEQAGQPIEILSGGGVQAPISPFSVLAKGLQAYNARKQGEGLDAEEKTIAENKARERANFLAELMKKEDVVGSENAPVTAPTNAAFNVPGLQPANATLDLPNGFQQQDIVKPRSNADRMALLLQGAGSGREDIANMIPMITAQMRNEVEDTRYEAGQKKSDARYADTQAQQTLENKRNADRDAFARQEAARDNARAAQAHADAMQLRRDALVDAVEQRKIAREQKLSDQKLARELKPENQFQASSAGFADRMILADHYLKDPDVVASSTSQYQSRAAGVPVIGNYLTSTARKSRDQAVLSFVNAKLRQESGATIGDPEFVKADLQYFPQPNDPPEIIKQKENERALAIEGMVRNAGPNYKRFDPEEVELKRLRAEKAAKAGAK